MLVKVNVKKLSEIRNQQGLSQYSLSKKAELGKNAVWQLESKKYDKCSLVRLKVIADILGIDVQELVLKDNDKGELL